MDLEAECPVRQLSMKIDVWLLDGLGDAFGLPLGFEVLGFVVGF